MFVAHRREGNVRSRRLANLHQANVALGKAELIRNQRLNQQLCWTPPEEIENDIVPCLSGCPLESLGETGIGLLQVNDTVRAERMAVIAEPSSSRPVPTIRSAPSSFAT